MKELNGEEFRGGAGGVEGKVGDSTCREAWAPGGCMVFGDKENGGGGGLFIFKIILN